MQWAKQGCLYIAFFLLLGIPESGGYAKELVVALNAMPKTIDPRLANDVNGYRITQQLLYGTLIEQDYDLKIIPSLAERWETPTPTNYIFYLRKNARFFDGSPVMAADVKYTFDSVMDPKTASPFQFVKEKIKAVEVIGPHTIRFESVAPQASFLLDLFIPIFKTSTDEQGKIRLVGAGPFQLKRKTASQIILAPNPYYYGGKPALKQIVFKVIKDDNTRFLKFKKGSVDFGINAIPMDKLKQFTTKPLNQKYKLLESAALSYQYLGFNMKHPVLKHKLVRQAIAHAMNREELIQYYKHGHAVKANSLMTPQNEFYSKNLPQYNYDLKKANQLLDQAGYPLRGNKRFTLEYKTTSNKEAVRQARIIKEQLKKVGIEIHVRSLEWGTFFGDVTSGNFALYSLRWVGVSEPDFYYNAFHSTQFPPSGHNRVRYTNPKLDQLVEAGRVEMNSEKRKTIYDQVQQILAEDLPYLSLWYNNNVVIIKEDLKEYRLHPTGGYHSFKLIH
ncbi:MAG: ABC transporter substrate-binding protein [SAR324 cluster bacterium]|nr:ABC transporter substrate-binding protein [SAR324 cluster bacterium]